MDRLLEREAELAALAGLVDAAVSGRGSVTLVAGEAGSGKTSLVNALRERVGGESVAFLVGACEPLSVPVPLAPLRELSELAGGGDLNELRSDDRLVLARALLRSLAARAPAVAVVEDVHWADPMTFDLLRLLTRRIGDSGVALLVTYRDDEVSANPQLGLLLGDLATRTAVTRLELRPLSEAAVRELAAPQQDARELVRLTGGNPFLVVEAIATGNRLPATVREAALARAGRLSESARTAVESAAVLGRRFPAGLLDMLLPGSSAAVDEALAHGVLIADGTVLGFRHELIREAIETSIPPGRRAELHRRVLAALAQQPGAGDNARLAHHAELGGLPEEAARYAADAAADADRVGALHEVWLQADRALRLGEQKPSPERFELLLTCSRTANFASSDLEIAVDYAERAAALADELGDTPGRGRALIRLAWALWSADRLEGAKRAAERAIAELEPLGGEPYLRALATDVRMEATAFDPLRAIEVGAHALEIAGDAGLDELHMDITISIGLARGHLGEPEALDILRGALDATRAARLTIQTVRTYINLLFIAATLRSHALVDEVGREAIAFLEEYGTPIPRLAMMNYIGRSLLDRGRWDEALEAASQSQTKWHAEVPGARAVEAIVAARRGDAGAYQVLAGAWEEIQSVPEGSRHANMRALLVEAAWLRGDHDAAREQIDAARRSPVTPRFARPAAELALWASRYGIEYDAPRRVPAPIALELAGDWRAAIRAWQDLEAPYEAALAALPGDDAAARAAQAVLHRLGGSGAARAFQRERASAGGRAVRGPRASTLANAAGLTRREQDVLEHLATGATNASISAELHLSERTVAHHVSAILGKLGAPNRLTAVEQARALGLLGKDGLVGDPK